MLDVIHLQIFPEGDRLLCRQIRSAAQFPLLKIQGLAIVGQFSITAVNPYILWLLNSGVCIPDLRMPD